MIEGSKSEWPLNLAPADLISAEFYGPGMVNMRERLLRSLNECMHVRAMTGFFTGWGHDKELMDALRNALAKPTASGKSMVVVDPFGGVKCAKALRDLRAGIPDHESRIRVHAMRLSGSGDPSSRVLMHSKLWLFRMPDRAEIWIGSANATRTAVHGLNVESTCVATVRPDAPAYEGLAHQVDGFRVPRDHTITALNSTIPANDSLLRFIEQDLVRRPAWHAEQVMDQADWSGATIFLYQKDRRLPSTAMLVLDGAEQQVLQLERRAYATERSDLARALAASGRGQYWASLNEDRTRAVQLRRGDPPVHAGNVGEFTVTGVREHYRPSMKWERTDTPDGLPKSLRFERLREVGINDHERGYIYTSRTE